MKSIWLEKSMCYDGSQLRSHWIYGETGELGDAVISFEGGADVPLKNMVDLVDVRNKDSIFSKSMLHFIIEHFDCDLNLAVARQRLLTAIVAEELKKNVKNSNIVRSGDDIYEGKNKLSVSIATASPVSSLIHFAINIISEGTPVPTKGLNDYNIDFKKFSATIMSNYTKEIASMHEARCKVRTVK